jgi:hypothetical protein
MKKRSLTIVIFLLNISITFAQNQIGISAQIRPRFQMNDKDFNNDIASENYTELRTRLGLRFSPTKNISGYIQLQDSRIYGIEPSTITAIDNIDLHQAYFEVQKIFSLPFNIRLGRLELSFGPQRFIGAVDWHNVGQSFDGGVIKLVTEKVNIDFFSAMTNEERQIGDTNDFSLIGAYGDLNISDKYKIQPFVISEIETGTDFNRYTVGIYISGELGGFSHELEGAYQAGSINENIDIAAFMFALNMKYCFNHPLEPGIGAGIDYLSGDDGEDPEKSTVFNTLYATNHKYYGFMDYFLDIPEHTLGLGLMDLHLKADIQPLNNLKAAFAFHIFNANADFTLLDGEKSTSFGSEIDLTLIYTYNKAVKFQGGYSLFSPGDVFKQKHGEDISTWWYLMAVVDL